MADLIKIAKDHNYDYIWTVDGNKYGDPYDITNMAGFADTNLVGWEEVLAVNGSIFYTYENKHYACGLEKSRGINNQEFEMSCVSDYHNAMAIGCHNDELVFASQKYIEGKIGEYYGAITGIGIMLNGQDSALGHKEFSSQYNSISGRTIIGEDKDGNYMSLSFSGVTGKTGKYGKDLYKLCKSEGFHNAILLDGGGSVWRRYMGKNDIVTTRKVKNALLLYRKRKTTPVNKRMFLERVSEKGIKGNKYWYDSTINKAAGGPNQLPNCTTYCVGRTAEIDNANTAIKMFKSRDPGGFGNAATWYSDSIWAKGSEPKIGAIAVWGTSGSQPYGHVAVVERIQNDGVVVSQSNYGGKFFEYIKYKPVVGSKTSGVGLPFIGYIYNPDILDKRVIRNPKNSQVEILGEQIRARKEPAGEIYTGLAIPLGIYDILDVELKEGYQWVKLDDKVWCAYDPSWAILYEAEKEADKELEKIKKEYLDLQTKYEQLEKDYAVIDAKAKETDRLTQENVTLVYQLEHLSKEYEKLHTRVDNAINLLNGDTEDQEISLNVDSAKLKSIIDDALGSSQVMSTKNKLK